MSENLQRSQSRRKLATSWKVALSDKIAKQVITIGGLATIASVLLVVLVLVSNVLPLLRSSEFASVPTSIAATSNVDDNANAELQEKLQQIAERTPLHSGVDEFIEIAWFLTTSGDVIVRSTQDNRLIAVHLNAVETDATITSSFRDRSGNHVLLGRSDGTIQKVELNFATSYIKLDELEPTLASQFENSKRVVGTLVSDGDSTYRLLAGRLVRRQRLQDVGFSELQNVVQDPAPILHIASLPATLKSSFDASTTSTFAAISDKEIVAGRIDTKVNNITDARSTDWTHQSSALEPATPADQIVGVMVHQLGNQITACMARGQVARWTLDPSGAPSFDRVSEPLYPQRDSPIQEVSATTSVLGDNTMIIGGEKGELRGAFWVRYESGDKAGTQEFVSPHHFEDVRQRVLAVGASAGSRIIVAIEEDNVMSLSFVPTEMTLERHPIELDGAPKEVWFSRNQDQIGVLAGDQLHLYPLSLGYPEASWRSFFRPVWYEGYAQPESIWQSSSAGVDAEPKLSMLPLIFGTFKATFYSLLIAVPLALMAAVYSSEFLSRPVRIRVKPVIELMAGIPSVVLGFIAALVLASIFREHLFEILFSLFTLVFTLALVGNLWLLLPQQVYLRLENRRTLFMLVIVPIGLYAAWIFGPSVERLLFGQSLIEWLENRELSAWPGWFLLFMPISLLLVSYFSVTVVASLVRPLARSMSAQSFAYFMVARYLLVCVCVVTAAALLATVCTSLGWDVRGTVFGGYQERNALLVGAILGFAIIPIIYTIAEDALQAVPQHLRSASLGCGATAWQTTTRIVLPTAMSGLFGGIMIGFGRAVGETMVVLMAAGNTPVMDVNPFNGYRTLSATLATELPESARASAHFHTLFLAALLLFAFTLVANTLAEFVRARFRKRSFQL